MAGFGQFGWIPTALQAGSGIVVDLHSSYLDTNEWQAAGIVQAIASLDAGKGTPTSASREDQV